MPRGAPQGPIGAGGAGGTTSGERGLVVTGQREQFVGDELRSQRDVAIAHELLSLTGDNEPALA